MNEDFKRTFLEVKNQTVLSALEKTIIAVKESKKIADISNIKKLKGHKTVYRIRIGTYRVGLYIENDTVYFVRILSRANIYKNFP